MDSFRRKKPENPVCSLAAGDLGTRFAPAAREFVQHNSPTVSLPVCH
jgi:hypothetical protein